MIRVPSAPVSLAICFAASVLLAGCTSCEKAESDGAPAGEERDPVTGLSPTEAKEELARVGDHVITLGEYARTLARMDEFERMRYQTPERQAELLEELIDAELLAQEAVKRGLDKTPEFQAQLFLALRDEMKEELRRQLPPLSSFSEAEVNAYYQAHRPEFEEPERRRPLVIVTNGRQQAESAIALLKNDPKLWGSLVKERSQDKRNLSSTGAPELAGDLGFVSAPGQPRGANADVPEEVRAELFRLPALGAVADAPVQVGDRFYVVRHGGTSAARTRSLAEAAKTIRVELRRQLFRKKEAELMAELEKKYPAVVRLPEPGSPGPGSPEPGSPGAVPSGSAP